MFFLVGPRQLLETAVLLGSRFREPGTVNRETVRRAFLRFLWDYQPDVPHSDERDTEFVSDPARTRRLASLFRLSRTDDIHKNVIEEDRIGESTWGLEVARAAFLRIRQEHPAYSELLTFQTRFVFSAPSKVSRGGTSSAALGVIWSDVRKKWSLADVYEFFIHENTHTSIFLDELRYRHYSRLAENVLDRSRYKVSAVLDVQRPVDKALHSLVVSTEILAARQSWLGHPKSPRLHPRTDQLLLQAQASLEALATDASRAIMPRGRDLLEMCRTRIADVRDGADHADPSPAWSLPPPLPSPSC